MSTALKISVNACCVNSASTLTNDPWINETMRRVCVRTNLQCNGQEMVCFCFLFGGPKAPDPAGRRPLNERLKTLRPGSVERRNASSMTLTASSSAMFCNAFCIRRDAFCPGRVRICVLLCSMFQAKSWFFRLPRNTRCHKTSTNT